LLKHWFCHTSALLDGCILEPPDGWLQRKSGKIEKFVLGNEPISKKKIYLDPDRVCSWFDKPRKFSSLSAIHLDQKIVNKHK
jgi:hypothetical protein